MRVPINSTSHIDVTFRRERATYSHTLPSGEIVTKPKTHPDTIVLVTLYGAVGAAANGRGTDVRIWTARVGCSPSDRFSKEAGRMAALRKVGEIMPSHFFADVMRAYVNRPRPKDLTALRRQYTALMHQIAAAEARQREAAERMMRDLSADAQGG